MNASEETAETKVLLLVEDEHIIAAAEKLLLEKLGFRVLVARSGEEAVALAGSAKGSAIVLILMDIDLGRGIDGTDAAVEILKSRDLPIIFISSHAEPDIIEKTKRITPYGYLNKIPPVSILDATIKMALRLFDELRRQKAKEAELGMRIERLSLAVEGFAEELTEPILDALDFSCESADSW